MRPTGASTSDKKPSVPPKKTQGADGKDEHGENGVNEGKQQGPTSTPAVKPLTQAERAELSAAVQTLNEA